MSPAHKAIKIIKREQRTAVPDEEGKTSPSLKTENEIRRQISSTITSWVEATKKQKRFKTY